ncbi:mRNA surveillance protein Pelota [Thermocladium modestius]|uniref:mRNA surveillance protein Pelota n=1 Tax=Thermocladium modestius TaxID=62609 RepID=A0A830GR84_9CREN|nr:pelota family protein [Thermocladium modestius]GGP18842.1 mRNA surveillance protein Pelota [Thermocladium modestius]
MRIEYGRDYVDLTPEFDEDLFILYLIINEGDVIYSWTVREIRGKEGERGEREKVYLGLRVIDVEYHEFREGMRIRGVIVNYPEWLEGAGGSHHSVDVVRGQTLRFVKQIDRDFLESLIKAFSGNLRVLVASISVEETAFALMSRIGIRMLGTMPNKSPPSKRAGSYELTAYLRDVGVNLSRYIGQTKPSLVMLAAPSMLLDSVKKSIASLAVPVKYVAIHEGGITGIGEVQRLGVLEEMGIELGSNSMDEVMRRLSRGSGDVAIGMDEVRTAAEQGAIERLLVEELFFKENAKSLQGIILSCIRAGGTVSIIPKGSEAGQRLRGLGGVAALLRFEFFLKGN